MTREQFQIIDRQIAEVINNGGTLRQAVYDVLDYRGFIESEEEARQIIRELERNILN